MLVKHGATLAAALLASTAIAHAQSIQTLRNQIPEIPIYGFLLTDGTAMVQGSNGTLTVNRTNYGDPNGSLSHWFKLTPDKTGSYLNGTWSRLADAVTYKMTPGGLPVTNAAGQYVRGPYEPEAGGGAVLRNGRLALVGGEYRGNSFVFTLTNETTVYNPFGDSWLPVVPPQPFQGQGGFQWFGDSPTAVLPNGILLIGQKLTKRAVALDPQFYNWIQYGELMSEKNDFNAEEGWTLLPDGTILTADVQDSPNTERLIPASDPTGWRWINAGRTPVDLRSPPPPGECCIPYDNGQKFYNAPGEIGPAMLRPDGTVFATGSLPYRQTQGHTAIFTPGPNHTGSWTAGPDFQPGDNAGDNFAVLEPNGKVLVEGDQFYVAESLNMPALIAKRHQAEQLMRAQAPNATAQQAYPSAHLYEFDGTNLTQLSVGVEGGATLLPLPSGQVLAMGYDAQLFTPADTTHNAAWEPTITSAPSTISADQSYRISGTQFNGLSQACAFGDEFQCATNYPLVRITNVTTGHVAYAATFGHSTMAVATGSLPVSTNFKVPADIEKGASMIHVVANGIASAASRVTVE